MRKGLVFNFLLCMAVFIVILGTHVWVFNNASAYDMAIAISFVLIFFSFHFYDRRDRTCDIFIFWLSYFPIMKLTKEIAGVATNFYWWEYLVFAAACCCIAGDIYWKPIKKTGRDLWTRCKN